MKLKALGRNLILAAVGVGLMASTLVEAKTPDWYGLPVGSGAAIGAAIDINNVEVADGVRPTAHLLSVPLKRYYSEGAAKSFAQRIKDRGELLIKPWEQLSYSTCTLTLAYYPEYQAASYAYASGPYFEADGTVIDGYNDMEAGSGYPSKEVDAIAAAAFEKLFHRSLASDYSLVTSLSPEDRAAGWRIIKQDNTKAIALYQEERVGEYGPVRVREYFTRDTIKRLMAETCLEAFYYTYEDMNNRNKYAYCEYVLQFARQRDIPEEAAKAKGNSFMWKELGDSPNRRCYYDANGKPVIVKNTGHFENQGLVDTWFGFEPLGQEDNPRFTDFYKDRLTVWAHCQERQD